MNNVDECWNGLFEKLHAVIERGSAIADYFLEIRGLFDDIPKLVLYDDSPVEVSLAHYTTWENALNMFNPEVGSPVLRMYNYEQSNDPDEGQIIPPEWKEVIGEASWLDDYLGRGNLWERELKFGGSTYGCSFSSGSDGIEDDLTYWRLYDNDGQGCSLKISSLHGLPIYKVRYRDKETGTEHEEEDGQVAERLRYLLKLGKEAVEKAPGKYKGDVGRTFAEGLQKIIFGYCHLIKHKAYAGEGEWRMIKVMPKRNEVEFDTNLNQLVKRYVEGPALHEILLSSSAITIGPTVPNRGAACAYIERLVKKKHNINHVDVRISDKTYRSSLYLNP